MYCLPSGAVKFIVTGWHLIVMPFSRSRSIASRSCSFIWRFSIVFVCSSRRSESVVLPWSTCAMMQKLRMWSRDTGRKREGVEGLIGLRTRQSACPRRKGLRGRRGRLSSVSPDGRIRREYRRTRAAKPSGAAGAGALHHAGEGAAGTTFVELGDAGVGGGLAVIFPEHRGDDLLDQGRAEVGRLGERAAGGVGVDGDLGALELDALEEGLEGLTRRAP